MVVDGTKLGRTGDVGLCVNLRTGPSWPADLWAKAPLHVGELGDAAPKRSWANTSVVTREGSAPRSRKAATGVVLVRRFPVVRLF